MRSRRKRRRRTSSSRRMMTMRARVRRLPRETTKLTRAIQEAFVLLPSALPLDFVFLEMDVLTPSS
jgi:hypothetical protein